MAATITLQHGECNECGEYSEYRHLMDLLKWQEKRKEIGVPLTAKLLLSVGELSVRKNHKVVVEALQELPLDYSDYWYVIVGRGPLHDELLAADHTGRLKLLGYRTDIVELLRASDLFVFPSLQEGLPVALMEAMACGVPCIASKIRGNVDLLDDDSTVINNNWVEKIQTACRNRILSREYRKENIENKMKMIYKG